MLVPALVENFNYQLCFLGFNWDPTGDQSAMFQTEAYGAGFNAMKYSNPEVDAAFAAAAVELDDAARIELQIQILSFYQQRKVPGVDGQRGDVPRAAEGVG